MITGWLSAATWAVVRAEEKSETSSILPLTKSTALPLYKPWPIIVLPVACQEVVKADVDCNAPLTYSEIVPAPTLSTPTR